LLNGAPGLASASRLSIPLRARVPDSVRQALAVAAPGWPVRIDVRAGIAVTSNRDGLRIAGRGVDRVADDAWEAAHWVLAGAIGAEAEARPGSCVLDGGALLTLDGASVFAGASHAGKSSVALHLAAAGIVLLGDDRLILSATDATVIGVGLARKIRTPLPADFAVAARDLAARARVGHAGGADILGWDPAIDRPAGTSGPIARIVLLRRDPSIAAARPLGLGAAEAVAALLPLCGRHAGDAADLLDAVAGLVARVPVIRLEAPNAAAAADWLLGAPVLGAPVLGAPVLGAPVLGAPVLGTP